MRLLGPPPRGRPAEAGRGRGEEEVAEGAVPQLLDGVHQGALGGDSIDFFKNLWPIVYLAQSPDIWVLYFFI